MNKQRFWWSAAAVFTVYFGLVLYAAFGAPQYPVTRYVNDYANVLSSVENTSLASKLIGSNTAVLIVPSLDGKSIEEVSIEAAKAAKIGDATKNDGALVVLAPSERKIRIEVGYGKEETITDTKALEVIQTAKPALKAGRWYEALSIIINGVR